MPRAPQINSARRPNRSTVQNEIGVEQTLTKVVIKEIRKGLSIVPITYQIAQVSVVSRQLTQALKEDRAEVEDEVNTGKLLHHLCSCPDESASKVGAWISHRTLEAVEPALDISCVATDRSELQLVISNDLSEFLLDELGCLWLTSQPRQTIRCVVEVATLDPIPW